MKNSEALHQMQKSAESVSDYKMRLKPRNSTESNINKRIGVNDVVRIKIWSPKLYILVIGLANMFMSRHTFSRNRNCMSWTHLLLMLRQQSSPIAHSTPPRRLSSYDDGEENAAHPHMMICRLRQNACI